MKDELREYRNKLAEKESELEKEKKKKGGGVMAMQWEGKYKTAKAQLDAKVAELGFEKEKSKQALSHEKNTRLNGELLAEKDKVDLQKKVDGHAATIASKDSEIVHLKSKRDFYKKSWEPIKIERRNWTKLLVSKAKQTLQLTRFAQPTS